MDRLGGHRTHAVFHKLRLGSRARETDRVCSLILYNNQGALFYPGENLRRILRERGNAFET